MQKSKSVNTLNILHKNGAAEESNNPMQEPKSALFYNQTKVGVDILDQKFRLYLVKDGR